jgi:hypothetical protein
MNKKLHLLIAFFRVKWQCSFAMETFGSPLGGSYYLKGQRILVRLVA